MKPMVTLTIDIPFQMREDLRFLAVKKRKKIKELVQKALADLLKKEARKK